MAREMALLMCKSAFREPPMQKELPELKLTLV